MTDKLSSNILICVLYCNWLNNATMHCQTLLFGTIVRFARQGAPGLSLTAYIRLLFLIASPYLCQLRGSNVLSSTSNTVVGCHILVSGQQQVVIISFSSKHPSTTSITTMSNMLGLSDPRHFLQNCSLKTKAEFIFLCGGMII